MTTARSSPVKKDFIQLADVLEQPLAALLPLATNVTGSLWTYVEALFQVRPVEEHLRPIVASVKVEQEWPEQGPFLVVSGVCLLVVPLLLS